MSSNAIVSLMPGLSSAESGSLSPVGFASAWRTAASGFLSASIGSAG
jgi:hypothetical protein